MLGRFTIVFPILAISLGLVAFIWITAGYLRHSCKEACVSEEVLAFTAAHGELIVTYGGIERQAQTMEDGKLADTYSCPNREATFRILKRPAGSGSVQEVLSVPKGLKRRKTTIGKNPVQLSEFFNGEFHMLAMETGGLLITMDSGCSFDSYRALDVASTLHRQR